MSLCVAPFAPPCRCGDDVAPAMQVDGPPSWLDDCCSDRPRQPPAPQSTSLILPRPRAVTLPHSSSQCVNILLVVSVHPNLAILACCGPPTCCSECARKVDCGLASFCLTLAPANNWQCFCVSALLFSPSPCFTTHVRIQARARVDELVFNLHTHIAHGIPR